MKSNAIVFLCTAGVAVGCGGNTTMTTTDDGSVAQDLTSGPDLTMGPAGDMTSKCPDGKVVFAGLGGAGVDVNGIKLGADNMSAVEPMPNDPWFTHLVTRTLMKDLVSTIYESHGKLEVTVDASSLTLLATGSAKSGGVANKGASVMMGFSDVSVKICDDAAPNKKYTLKFECTPTTVTKTGQGQVFYGNQHINTLYCDYFKGTTNAMNTLDVTADADGKASTDMLGISLRVDAGGQAIGDTSTSATLKVTVQ